MGTKTQARNKGRAATGRFAGIPIVCMDHPNYTALGNSAIRLLLEFARQYNGRNNGDLCCAWALMRERGWRSKATVDRACRELVSRGWIERTRQGGRNQPNLYALTFYAIDECKGKLDVKPTATPSGLWRTAGLKVLDGYRKAG